MINISFKNHVFIIKLGYIFFSDFYVCGYRDTYLFQIFQNVVFLEEFYHDRKNWENFVES